MHNDTRTTIRSICRADGTISEEQIDSAIAALEGKVKMSAEKPVQDRLLSRQEVARLINRQVETVDYYCRKGAFRRVFIGGSTRSSGISEASVNAWLNPRNDALQASC